MTLFLSLIVWFLSNVLWQADPCAPGGILLTRQGQVDSFNILYPGCDQVIGNVTIEGPVTRLDSLYRIQSIGGYLFINATTGLKSLSGLSGLQTIGAAIYVTYNNQLNTFSGLNALQSFGGELYIFQNDSLSDISAIGQVSFNPAASLRIINCPKLSVCNLPFICQYASLGGAPLFQNNAPGCNSRFQVVSACNPGLLCPPGNLLLRSQPDIQDFVQYFPNCSSLGGSLNIFSGEGPITSLSPLLKIKSIAGSLTVNSNNELPSLSGLDSLQTIGVDCNINFNPRIKNLDGLSGLQWINQTLIIGSNDSLTSLQSLGPISPDSLSSLFIYNCPLLTVCSHPSICSFLAVNPRSHSIDFNGQGCNTYLQVIKNCYPEAQCPTGPLILRSQQSINEFYSLYPNCTDYPDGVEIFSEFIKNLDSLYKLKSISGSLLISNNDSLVSIHGLSGLKSVGGEVDGEFVGQFFITDNKMLASLDGLDSLTFIGREININRNDSLKDITGLNQVQFSTDNNVIYLYDNPVLSVCNIPSICTFLDAGGFVGAGRNSTGCSSLYQILKSCNPDLVCPPGDIYLHSQEEIEDFAQSFPDCSEISGLLNIESDIGAIVSLAPLSKIKTVRGGLNITGNLIPDLHGLDSLSRVEGVMHINYNYRLHSLDGLSGLKILDALYIQNNDSLVNLNGLSGVNPDSLIYLNIHDNPQLSVCAQEKICVFLSRPNADYDIGGNAPGCNTYLQIISACGVSCPPGTLQFHTQTELNEFGTLFPGCETIPGGVLIGPSEESDPIISLAPLSKIKSIGGDVDIEINPRLKSLMGLDSLQEIEGHLQIGINDSLVNLSGLGSLNSLSGQLLIQSNTQMTSLTGLGQSQIDNITGIIIEDNPVLSMCGIPPVCNYMYPLFVQLVLQNNAPGCNTLGEIRSDCGIMVCGEGEVFLSSQEDVDQFPLNYPGCDRLLEGLFINGPTITNLDSLRQIKHIGSYLVIIVNPLLTSITGLSNLETVGGEVDISNNPLLTSTQGLSSLRSIGGYLGIYTNNILSSLGNFDQLDYTTITELYIQENPYLSVCDVPPVCSFVGDSSKLAVTFIDGNNNGCDSRSQVRTACGLATCPTGNIVLTTQADVNNFRSLLMDCTVLPGDLVITGPDITYLDSLSVISGIQGELRVENTSLHSLFGLNEILSTSISHLVIKNNPTLATCDIRSVCDYISVPANTYEIIGNAPTCESVSAVMAECSKTCFWEGISFTTQAQVDAFAVNYGPCEYIPGNIFIEGPDIVSLDSFYKIKTIGGSFNLVNTSVTSLRGLEALESVGGFFDIRNNAILTNLNALHNLRETGHITGASFRVQGNAQLTDITGLHHLKTAHFNLIIASNAMLTNLSGLDSVLSVVNNVQITGNAKLISTSALLSLSRVGNDLRIENNALLAEADGFESLNYVGNDMRILNNLAINTLRSFIGLDTVQNLLRIEGNNSLDSLTGLSAVRFVGNGLRIRNNLVLKTLNALSQLTHVGQELVIFNNDSLTSLQGLDGIDPNLLFSLTIQSSNLLNLCSVRSVCNYLAITPVRTINISSNLTGCNSGSEILTSCASVFPVSLISFDANLKDRNAILKWRIASVQGLESYEPQHSTDGVHFKTLGSVPAGKQIVPFQTLEWTHHSPPAGLNYYRLKLVEQDAGYSYSDVVKLFNGEQIQIFPNPTRDKFYIRGISIYPASVEIHDLLGRTILKSMVSEGQALDLSNQPGGIYMFSILTGYKKAVFRVIRE